MASPLWRLLNLEDRLDEWIDREGPQQDLILVVTAWTMTRFDDPYRGLRREPGQPNLWFGKVPRTYEASTRSAISVVLFVEERSHEVRFDRFARLGLPI